MMMGINRLIHRLRDVHFAIMLCGAAAGLVILPGAQVRAAVGAVAPPGFTVIQIDTFSVLVSFCGVEGDGIEDTVPIDDFVPPLLEHIPVTAMPSPGTPIHIEGVVSDDKR